MKNEKSKPIQENICFFSDDLRVSVSNGKAGPQDKAFHESLEIKYFYEGRSMVMIDSDLIIAEPGDITVVNPYEIHTNITNESYMGKYYLVMVDLDFFSDTEIGTIDLRQLLLVKRLRFNHHIKNNARLADLILKINSELSEKKEYYRLIVANLFSEFFALLLRDELNTKKSEVPEIGEMHQNNVIAPALEKIFRDYGSHITVDELAHLCSLSKYHFCRIFKRRMGVTVTQYIINYRISLAESLLKDETRSIKSVAAMCGFGDISYFYQCYKRIKGTPPGKAREE